MDQTLTGTVHGNTIVLDALPGIPAGERVEVVVRHLAATPPARVGGDETPPSWWTDQDDRILEEIYQARKLSTRRDIVE